MSPGSDKLCPGGGKYACIKVTWQPYVDGNNPGSHFYVQYKKSMETQYLATQEQLNQDSIIGMYMYTAQKARNFYKKSKQKNL